jgi:hypothetical protein
MQLTCQEQLPLGSGGVEAEHGVVEIVCQEGTILLVIGHVPDPVAQMVRALFDMLLLHSIFLCLY